MKMELRDTMKTLTRVVIIFAMIFTALGMPVKHANAAAKSPKKITLKTTSKTVDVNGTVKVSVKSVKPSTASKTVTFKSSDKKVATVTKKGHSKR